jgi:hypothetical protein
MSCDEGIGRPFPHARRTVFRFIEEGLLMRGFFVVLVLLVVGAVGLGFYRGWFEVSTGSTSGKANATITVDRDKIQADQEKVKKQVQDVTQKVGERAGAATGKGKEEARAP